MTIVGNGVEVEESMASSSGFFEDLDLRAIAPLSLPFVARLFVSYFIRSKIIKCIYIFCFLYRKRRMETRVKGIRDFGRYSMVDSRWRDGRRRRFERVEGVRYQTVGMPRNAWIPFAESAP